MPNKRQRNRWSRSPYSFGKTGNKKRATCFAPLLQNKWKRQVARFTTHVQPDLLQDRFDLGGKTRKVAIQLANKLHAFGWPFFRTLIRKSFSIQFLNCFGISKQRSYLN